MVKQFSAIQESYASSRYGKGRNLGEFDTIEEAEAAVEQALKIHPNDECTIKTVYRSEKKVIPSDLL